MDRDRSIASALDLLPHALPMRLIEEVMDLTPGISARCRRTTRADDWFFRGHFPGAPVVPAVVLIEIVAQTGGLAVGAATAATIGGAKEIALRVAAVGSFKFPAAAGPGMQLEASARVVGRLGGLYKIEGEVTADGRLVASGSLTLAEPRH